MKNPPRPAGSRAWVRVLVFVFLNFLDNPEADCVWGIITLKLQDQNMPGHYFKNLEGKFPRSNDHDHGRSWGRCWGGQYLITSQAWLGESLFAFPWGKGCPLQRCIANRNSESICTHEMQTGNGFLRGRYSPGGNGN